MFKSDDFSTVQFAHEFAHFRMTTNEHNNILDLTKFDCTIVYKDIPHVYYM